MSWVRIPPEQLFFHWEKRCSGLLYCLALISLTSWDGIGDCWSCDRGIVDCLSLPCLSGLIRRFALHNLCDLNPTSWAASVAQLVERLS